MTPIEYLDAYKATLTPPTDYEAAKRLEVPQIRLTDVRKGRRPLTPYLCAKIAIALELDPAAVIADVESQTDKDAKRRSFWKSFLARAAMLAVCVTLGWNYSAGLETGRNINGGNDLLSISGTYLLLIPYLSLGLLSHNVYYVKL